MGDPKMIKELTEEDKMRLAEAQKNVAEMIVSTKPVADSMVIALAALGMNAQEIILVGSHVIAMMIEGRVEAGHISAEDREGYVWLVRSFILTMLASADKLKEVGRMAAEAGQIREAEKKAAEMRGEGN